MVKAKAPCDLDSATSLTSGFFFFAASTVATLSSNCSLNLISIISAHSLCTCYCLGPDTTWLSPSFHWGIFSVVTLLKQAFLMYLPSITLYLLYYLFYFFHSTYYLLTYYVFICLFFISPHENISSLREGSPFSFLSFFFSLVLISQNNAWYKVGFNKCLFN